MTMTVQLKAYSVMVPLMMSCYLMLYGSHPFAPTMVTENAPAEVVAVNNNRNGDLQIVVIVPGGGGRLSMIERPRESYWYAYQWPEVPSLDHNTTINVCYTTTTYGGGAQVVDVDCTSVKWFAFFVNVTQGVAFVILVHMTGTLCAYLAASLYATFCMRIARHSVGDPVHLISDIESSRIAMVSKG
jgi:hypothetical protein